MRRGTMTLLVLAVVGTAEAARAQSYQPYRVRADAYGQTRQPVGLITLQGDSTVRPWLSAEAYVWGATGNKTQGDVLVVAVEARDPGGLGRARAGRFFVSPGALRPVHMDGVDAKLRLPFGLSFQAFGGKPVVPRFGNRAYDWVAGGRLAQATGDWGSVGVAYVQRRERGSLAYEQIGADAFVTPLDWLDLAGRAAFDLLDHGVSEAHASATARLGAWLLRAFAFHRSPARLLSATSLFSVLGNAKSRQAGGSIDWAAAPRLDLRAVAAARAIGSAVGARVQLNGTLRLDDDGLGALGLELRRDSAALRPDPDWTGVRVTGRAPVAAGIYATTELELVVPDEPRGRGKVWPWGRVALTWTPFERWEAAAAFQASASPQYARRFDGRFRLSYAWEGGG